MNDKNSGRKIITRELLIRIKASNLPLEDINIGSLNLSRRPDNALRKARILNLHKLVNVTVDDLISIPNIGVTSLHEVIDKTNNYLNNILVPEEFDRLFKISLYELLTINNPEINHKLIVSLDNNSFFLDSVPLSEVPISNGLIKELQFLGISSSTDIWVLALGHQLNIDPIYTNLITRVSKDIAGLWQITEKTDYKTNSEFLHTPNMKERITKSLKMGFLSGYSNKYLRVTLSIKASSSQVVQWEALIPIQYLTEKMNWVNYTDKTRGLCSFLINISGKQISNWAEPPTTSWDSLPRTHPKDTLNSWLLSTISRNSERDYEMFKDWFGLTSGERKTLDEVGQKYGITRERVRQIINRFLRSLLHSTRKKYLVPFVSHLEPLFRQHGNIMTLMEIANLSDIYDDFPEESVLRAAELVLYASRKYNAVDYDFMKHKLNNLELGRITWHENSISSMTIRKIRETAKKLVSSDPFRYSEDLIDVVVNLTRYSRDVVNASLRTYDALKRHSLGYTHAEGGEQHLTTSNMAVIALRELMVPAHYSVIHQKLRELFPGQSINIGTLLNTLNSNRFKKIDSGIYGL